MAGRTVGDKSPRPPSWDERVDEMVDESFPASDPPPTSESHAGEPKRHADGEDDKVVLSPHEARQGMIVLRSPLSRWLFIGSLVAAFAAVVAVAAFV